MSTTTDMKTLTLHSRHSSVQVILGRENHAVMSHGSTITLLLSVMLRSHESYLLTQCSPK